jgi:hypothetical protein
MDEALVRLVRQRAKNRCEYCRSPEALEDEPFQIDHIISKKHQGPTVAGNLALSCFRCNVYKGTCIAGRDPKTRKLTPLFNPRRHKWARHFRWQGPYLVGLTPVGRMTVALLRINDLVRVRTREELIAAAMFSPE